MGMAKKKRTTRSKPTGRGSSSPSLLSLFQDFRPTRFRKGVLERRASFMKELQEVYLHRGLVLYVGAGVSLSLGLPSWPELIRSLSVTMMSRRVESAIDALDKLTDEQKWEQLTKLEIQVEKSADSEKPILMMARAVKDDLGDRLPSAIARSLYRPVRRHLWRTWKDERFKRRLDERKEVQRYPLPTSALLDAIVSLVRAERDVKGVQAIVNYNFDDLLDEKLREQHVKCRTVLSGRDSVPPGTLPCYHVHGLISSQEYIRNRIGVKAKGNFVFSEDEYHAEYSDPYKWSNMTQMSLLGRYTGLFVGLSMEDPNIRRLIDVTHHQYPDNLNYAVLPRKRPLKDLGDNNESVLKNLFEEVETKSFEKIGVRVIWVDSHSEAPSLIQQICGGDGN
jgi:hypothetical protein